MPIRRSDTMRAVDAVQPLVDQFNALDDGDKLTFLDLVDPLPDKLTHSHKQKKSSKKAAGKGGGKSARATSLQQQIQKTVKPDSDGDNDLYDPECAFIVDDTTGEQCGAVKNDPIHDTRYLSSHEFQPGKSGARGAGRRSSANGADGSTEVNSETQPDGAGVAAGGD